jgi:enoyl-CoA hydratase/carnithine racemase
MSPHPSSASPTPHWRHLRLEHDDGVATVTLDRPDRLNALTFGAYADLRDLLAELAREGGTRALVLAGAGRGFCSGGDVEEIIGATLAMGAGELLDFTRMTGQVVRAVREAPFPVIAAVHGVAAGAGAVLALAADFRIAEPDARFAFLFTRVGLSGADMGAAYLLPRVVGLGHATRLLMLGETVDAAEAERIGLVNRVVDDGELDRLVEEWAARLAAGPPTALSLTKRMLNDAFERTLEEAVEDEARSQVVNFSGPDVAEAVGAWFEKREPRFGDR